MNLRTPLLQKFYNFNFIPLRTCETLPKGIKYHGFTYYPRTENFKDPPYKPTKLFLIKRLKSMKGTNPQEKNALQLLNIDGDAKYFGHINVVKNIPSVNCILWKVKHLIIIKPITCKDELPQNEDYSGTHLRDTGELIISPKLKVTAEQLEITEKTLNHSRGLRRNYMKEYLKKKWLNGFSGDI